MNTLIEDVWNKHSSPHFMNYLSRDKYNYLILINNLVQVVYSLKDKKRRSNLYSFGVSYMIGKRLKYVRTYFGDKQKDLAAKLNVSLSTVKSWERDNSSPNYDLLAKICRLYHVSSDYLIGLSDIDSFVQQETQDKLTQKSRVLVHLFEEFMLYKQQKDTTK